jgi:hypothetical protein
MSSPSIAPAFYDLIESLVNKLPANTQDDARNLFQAFSAGVIQAQNSLGISGGANAANVATPPQATLSVTGANGAFSIGITNPKLSTPATLWHEVSYSPVASFASNVTTLAPTQATSINVNSPGATVYFRIRSSYNQSVWNNYSVFGSQVSAGLVSSEATSEGGAFNQTNLGTVTSAASGSTANVSIQGANGALSSLVRLKGGTQQILPSATVIGATPGSNLFVGFDGRQYRLQPTLAAVLTDNQIPIGKVSVVDTGVPVLPAVSLVLGSNGSVIAWNVTNQGNGLSGPVTLTINTTTGAGATPGTQTIQNGKLISVAPGNPGSNYGSGDTVTVTGGVGGGTPGGGTAAGGNGGRMTDV